MCLILLQRLQTGQKESSICCNKCRCSFLARHPFLRQAFLRNIMDQKWHPHEIILRVLWNKYKKIHGFIVETPRDADPHWKQAPVLAAGLTALVAWAFAVCGWDSSHLLPVAQQFHLNSSPGLRAQPKLCHSCACPQVCPWVHVWISRNNLRPSCCLHFPALLIQARPVWWPLPTLCCHHSQLPACPALAAHWRGNTFSTVQTCKKTLCHKGSNARSQLTLQAFAQRLFKPINFMQEYSMFKLLSSNLLKRC